MDEEQQILNEPAIGLEMGTVGTNISTANGHFIAPANQLIQAPRTLYSFILNANVEFTFFGAHIPGAKANPLYTPFEPHIQNCTRHCLVFINPSERWIFNTPMNVQPRVVRAVWEQHSLIVRDIVLYPGQTVTIIGKPGHSYEVSILDPAVGAAAGLEDFEEECRLMTINEFFVEVNSRFMFNVDHYERPMEGQGWPVAIITLFAVYEVDNVNVEEKVAPEPANA